MRSEAVATDEVRKGESHATNDRTWASNIVASARTRMFGPVRKRNRTVQRSGSGWTANEAGSRSESVLAGLRTKQDSAVTLPTARPDEQYSADEEFSLFSESRK
jgi:hypothetical protein